MLNGFGRGGGMRARHRMRIRHEGNAVLEDPGNATDSAADDAPPNARDVGDESEFVGEGDRFRPDGQSGTVVRGGPPPRFFVEREWNRRAVFSGRFLRGRLEEGENLRKRRVLEVDRFQDDSAEHLADALLPGAGLGDGFGEQRCDAADADDADDQPVSHIDPDVIDEDDVEMLEDLIVAAVNDAMTKADAAAAGAMGQLTGGMNIPGLM